MANPSAAQNVTTASADSTTVMCKNCKKDCTVVDYRCTGCGESICILCGCTDRTACGRFGCYWVSPGICSACVN